MELTTNISSPRTICAEMRTKLLHDVDARGGCKPIDKQLKRMGKALCEDDDFVEDVHKIPSVKKPKVSPASSKQKKKKKKPCKKLPKLVEKKNLVKVKNNYFPFQFLGCFWI